MPLVEKIHPTLSAVPLVPYLNAGLRFFGQLANVAILEFLRCVNALLCGHRCHVFFSLSFASTTLKLAQRSYMCLFDRFRELGCVTSGTDR